MSEATNALSDGLSDTIGQHGVLVTSDITGSQFAAIRSSMFKGNIPTDSGLRDASGCILTFPRSSWSPVVGRRLSVEGIQFVVQQINYSSPAAYSVTCVESNK